MAGRLLLHATRALMDHKRERDDGGHEGQPVPLAFVIGAVIMLVVTPVATLFIIWKYCWRPSRLQAAAARAQAAIDGAGNPTATGLGKDELDAIPATVYSTQQRGGSSRCSNNGDKWKGGAKEGDSAREDEVEDVDVERQGCPPACLFLQVSHSEHRSSSTSRKQVEGPEAVVIHVAGGEPLHREAEAGHHKDGLLRKDGEIRALAVDEPIPSASGGGNGRQPGVKGGGDLLHSQPQPVEPIDSEPHLPAVKPTRAEPCLQVSGSTEVEVRDHRFEAERRSSTQQEQGGQSASGTQSVFECLSEVGREDVGDGARSTEGSAGRHERGAQEVLHGGDEAARSEERGSREGEGWRSMGRKEGVSPLPSVRAGRSVLVRPDDADTESQSVDATCAVCLGEFETGELVKTLPSCDHTFHALCIDAWLGKRASCPNCRQPVRVERSAADSDGGAGNGGSFTGSAPSLTTARVVAAGSPAVGGRSQLPRTVTTPTWLATQVFGSREGLPFPPAVDRSDDLLPHSAGLLLSFITRAEREQPAPQERRHGHRPAGGEVRRSETVAAVNFPEPRGVQRTAAPSGRRLSGSASAGSPSFWAPATASRAAVPAWRRSFGLPSGRGAGSQTRTDENSRE